MEPLLPLYILLVIILHLVPTSDYSLSSFTVGPFRGDYLLHLVCFLPWMFLLYIRFPKWKTAGKRLSWSMEKSKSGFWKGLSWACLGIIFAIGAETIHFWLPHRDFNPMDALFNIAGVAVGAGLFLCVQMNYGE